MNDNNMSDMMKNFSSMLNGKEIPDDVKNMLNSMMNKTNQNNTPNNNMNSNTNSSTTSNGDNSNNFDFSKIDPTMLLKAQQIMQNMNNGDSNARNNLLRSLKPYLKESRQEKVDQYIQLFNMEKVMEMLNNNSGGDKK